ncbi:MAG TPA: peptidylprolyl isomerase [Planctomycetaceae bacterium]|nr:peptidylprolyl isomerase [Planctomycetaceae bacterium]
MGCGDFFLSSTRFGSKRKEGNRRAAFQENVSSSRQVENRVKLMNKQTSKDGNWSLKVERSGRTSSRGSLKRLHQALAMFLSSAEETSPRRGRLLLEQLESRQMMAGDVDMLFTSSSSVGGSSSNSPALVASTNAEGEAAQDLVAFAKALADVGVTYYGAAWCPICTQQKELFQDGGDFLPFVEVTRSDRSLNAVGTAAGIEVFPTWEFPDGTRATGLQSLATLSQRSGVAIPQSANPSFVAIGNQSVAIGSPLHIPVNAYNPAGGPITVSVSVANPALLEAVVLTGNRSLRMSVAGYGDMVFELFEDKAPRPAGRVAQLAQDGFYDGIIFHRIIDNFMIQGGDPTGTGSGGSPLGNFDDQFHPDLQHNRSGVLSFAKSSDDTNNSQFFITEGPQRTLDFNHSVFGQLVEGDKVREAISEIGDAADKGTNASDRPLINIVIESATVFNDTENSVVMLKARGNQTGTTNVTFTATNATGQTFTQVVPVSVVADSGVGSNSAPFLADITNPAPRPNTSPATLQLSSTDVEGDAVEYFVSTTNASVTAEVNATTGLVTVTPVAGFVGTANVLVGVRPAAGVVGALANQTDTQSVPFVFTAAASAAPTAPTSVDLAAASDSGASNTDNITRSGSLTFNIAGVQAGAEVILFAGSVEVGRGISTGTTATVTTNNIAALGDGTYQITARQSTGGQVSSASQPLSITFDATQPVTIQNFPTAANVGIPLNVNLSHPEEGSGLTYGLTGAPAGATINPQTGVISWTPTTEQIGSQTMTLTLTDLAGNIRSQTFTVPVAAAPQAGTRLEIANLAGEVVTQVDPNQEFLLRFYARDLRSVSSRDGIFAAFADILFDSTRVVPVTSTPIQYGPGFGSLVKSGTFGTGVIDELGAVTDSLAATSASEALIATVRMRATGTGTVTFVSEPADLNGNDILLFNQTTAVADSLVSFGRVDLLIGSRFTAVNDTFTVVRGSAATNLNVLANDTFATGVTGTLTLSLLGTPSAGGTVSIQNNQVRYQPAATFVGTETFTYTATDNTGLARTATATVTVTSTAIVPPTAVNDTFTVVEDAPIATFNVLTNDTPSATGATLTITAIGTSTRGSTVEIVSGGQAIRYRPAANFNGTEAITYTVTDSGGGTATATVTFNVTAVNDAPPAANITRDVFRGDTNKIVASLADYGTNVDGTETLTVAIVGTPTGGGTFTVDGTSIRYTPPNSTFVGTSTVDYRTTDPSGLSSTGTLTINVLDSLPTQLAVNLNGPSTVRFGSEFVATLSGTTAAGQSVSRTVSFSTVNGSLQFADLPAGNYSVEVPAIPFLTGMDQPQVIAFSAAAAGGEVNRTVNVGRVKAIYKRNEDYFESSTRDKLFAVIEPGSDSLAIVGAEKTSLVLAPIVNLNENASTITIRGNTSTNTATQATIAFDSSRVQTRGVANDMRLVRLNLSGMSFTAPPATSSLSSTTTPEGESAASTAAIPATQISSLAAPPIGSAEGEGLSSSVNNSGDISEYFESQLNQSQAAQRDRVLSDTSDPVSLSAIQSETLQGSSDDGLPPAAVDEFLASF